MEERGSGLSGGQWTAEALYPQERGSGLTSGTVHVPRPAVAAVVVWRILTREALEASGEGCRCG